MGDASADMVEREARRIEVMRRRQEKELGQLINYELAKKEMQEKAEVGRACCMSRPACRASAGQEPGSLSACPLGSLRAA